MCRHPLAATLGVLALLAVVGATPAEAGPRQTQTEATFVGYDAEAQRITVKVRRTGRGRGAAVPAQLKLKRGEEAAFNVKDGSSVLTSTIVKSKQGTRMQLQELQPGTKLLVFWVPDPKDGNARFARSISVYVHAHDWKGAKDAQLPAAAPE